MRSLRLRFVVEGQTEEAFVNRVLAPHLGLRSIACTAHSVTTSRKQGRIFRGGLVSYAHLRADLLRWIKQEQGTEVFFTTMVDLYGLPKDFPGREKAGQVKDPEERARVLELAMSDDIQDPRLIPHLQVHEFEALILADPNRLIEQFPDQQESVALLARDVRAFNSPEEINTQDAPSKRIIQRIPGYAGRKSSAGPLVAESIGLDVLRDRCQHFGNWLSSLEQLPEPPAGMV